MNILVYPHQMVVGGSQINALELAAEVRNRGHQVTVVAPDGVLVSMVRQLGLDYCSTVSDTGGPSVRTALQLQRLARRLRIDLIHSYEWHPAMEAAFGPHLLNRIPVVITVLSMNVPKFLPRHLPLIVGTRELAMAAKNREVHVIEPPVDTANNQSTDTKKARARWGFDDDEVVIAVVCRMTTDLQKKQGVSQAIKVVGRLAERAPLRFLVVGAGEGLKEIEQEADAVNGLLGGEVIRVAGEMIDPRDAYDAADIVLGMGSSALRAMAFGKPLIVQGANGFWRLLDENSRDLFLWQGWYGDGGESPDDLEEILEALVLNPRKRAELGQFGRRLVADEFSLDRAADRLVDIYHRVIAQRSTYKSFSLSMMRSAAGYAKCSAVETLNAVRQGLA